MFTRIIDVKNTLTNDNKLSQTSVIVLDFIYTTTHLLNSSSQLMWIWTEKEKDGKSIINDTQELQLKSPKSPIPQP